MKLDEVTLNSKAWVLGVGSAMMIASSYCSDLVGTCGYNSDHDGLALRTIACCIDHHYVAGHVRDVARNVKMVCQDEARYIAIPNTKRRQ